MKVLTVLQGQWKIQSVWMTNINSPKVDREMYCDVILIKVAHHFNREAIIPHKRNVVLIPLLQSNHSLIHLKVTPKHQHGIPFSCLHGE